jgi:hypothetical protein
VLAPCSTAHEARRRRAARGLDRAAGEAGGLVAVATAASPRPEDLSLARSLGQLVAILARLEANGGLGGVSRGAERASRAARACRLRPSRVAAPAPAQVTPVAKLPRSQGTVRARR